HTRSKRDWSSDVCSSDLFVAAFFHNALFSVGFDFLEAAFASDKFGAQFPGGAAGFKLLRVLVYHQQVIDAELTLFGESYRFTLDAWGVARAKKGACEAGVVFG